MDSSSHGSPIRDLKRIDLDRPEEVAAWCTLLTLSEADLRTAVGLIGPMSAAVAVYVNSRGRRGAMRQVGEIGQPFERRAASRSDDGEHGSSDGGIDRSPTEPSPGK